MARRRKVRVKGRFYVFLTLFTIVIAVLIRGCFVQNIPEATVTMGTIGDSRKMEAVIMRNEVIVESEGGYGKIEYVAQEGALVHKGDLIASVYSSSYSERDVINLETTRQDIRTEHIKLLGDIPDKELERLDGAVNQKALELKMLVNGKNQGSLLNLEKQLESAMEERQEYLRRNMREIASLINLYDRESNYVNSIKAWEQQKSADVDGYVSFYVDGYEQLMNEAYFEMLTPSKLREVMKGTKIKVEGSKRGTEALYRLVKADKWSVILISKDNNWNPVISQSFKFQMEGHEGYVFESSVSQIKQIGNETLVKLDINGSPAPLMGLRHGKALIGSSQQGLKVPIRALINEGDQDGVRLSGVPGGVFVAVEVLAKDDKDALVRPLQDGTLIQGQKVLLLR